MNTYDLCVIGSGPAGQRAAIQSAKIGKRVCVVERLQEVGGVAVNTGTIPSKALREAILVASGRGTLMPNEHDFMSARSKSFASLLEAANKVIRHEVAKVASHFASNGIDVVYGSGSFTDPHTVRVTGAAVTEVKADRFLIAVGASPARPSNIPFDGQNVITSDELLRLPYLPATMLVIGGGVIGTEYASMLTALGVRVTLVEGRHELLGFVDKEIGEALQFHLRKRGMTLRMGEKAVSISVIDPPRLARSGNNQMAEVYLESDKTLRADCLLYCVGRQGATESLNLPAAGLKADSRGRIEVNENFQTAVEHIYAAGDVVGFPALASTSMEQGRHAACHMFGLQLPEHSKTLPYGVYSIPEISMVGMTEQELTEAGIPYESGVAQYDEIARGQLMGDELGMLKLLIHQETQHILGVHAIGAGATELIHIGQAVMALGGTLDYFIHTVFNYPTLAECYKVAALNGRNRLRST
ncbi:MAG: Si-specific NAD(P)(+) transhydrogenase [Phycisphaeraceae bacterium]|nr:Si-specific NAD(P)(+) transhydrogenase [Phycisphaeraceae bacterium]